MNKAVELNKKELKDSLRIKQLKEGCGDTIIALLANDDVNELALNEDGTLWAAFRNGKKEVAGKISHAHAERIIRKVAGIQEREVNYDNPLLSCEFPVDGSRFTAQLPPVVNSPAFTIRKKASIVYSFDDYLKSGGLNLKQAEVIREAIRDRKNILICGGPGSGKTTFTNACILELTNIVSNDERLLILEDVQELQCSAKNKLCFQTAKEIDHPVDMQTLVRTAMRSSPERIIVGEILGKEMLDVLKAWNTGCPGGMATIHSNDTHSALERCMSLAEEAGVAPPISLICEAIDIIISIQKHKVRTVTALDGYSRENKKFIFKDLA